MNETLGTLLIIAFVILGVLHVAPGLIWLERRLLALWQDRYGPNRVGPFGLFAHYERDLVLQPITHLVSPRMVEHRHRRRATCSRHSNLTGLPPPCGSSSCARV